LRTHLLLQMLLNLWKACCLIFRSHSVSSIYISGARTSVILPIIGFHYGILQWIWRGVNLKCIDAYAVLEWENDTKLHCHQRQGQHIQWTINSLWWLCLDLESPPPRQSYDVVWNPRMRKVKPRWWNWCLIAMKVVNSFNTISPQLILVFFQQTVSLINFSVHKIIALFFKWS
jgi:hypothetical protein